MTAIGEVEKRTQARVVKLFTAPEAAGGLGYTYLGDWTDNPQSTPVLEDRLRAFLAGRYPESLVARAVREFATLAADRTKKLYDLNHEVYKLLRYGVKLAEERGGPKRTVLPIDWENPAANDFALAEEVTVETGRHRKRPDVVLYVNGVALGVLELKRSTVHVEEGIRQNILNQREEFVRRFFSTVQLVLAGNDTQGLRYGAIDTPERYYLRWREEREVDGGPNEPVEPTDPRLDFDLRCVCRKDRLLELVHDFTVFDRGTKKLARPNQYFGARAARRAVAEKRHGIVWHTQGSGKSLTMVWLARWIKERLTDGRVLIVTDRKELDEQIEKVFLGVGEDKIVRTNSGDELVAALAGTLNRPGAGSEPPLICSLVHKFGRHGGDGGASAKDVEKYVEEVKAALPAGFRPKGEWVVFVDEAHRTQSNKLNAAMRTLLPDATFVGFTGTPLLKTDRKTSFETFGPYIHTYRFDEAVRDEVILDLRYEARDIDQRLGSREKIDAYFEAKTAGLTDVAKADLKKRWGTLQQIFSSKERLEQIARDVAFDMQTKPRLMDGTGNALLVCSSIYEACRYYEIFERTDLKGKIAVITSYEPTAASVRGEESGEGETERLTEYGVYRRMLAGWFDLPEDEAVKKAAKFEEEAKDLFTKQPGRMRLLIVVDKLLTGFDAPPATYLYIDKPMKDHGLFQAVCRVNRLDGDSKEYGYVVDYKDLFNSLADSVRDYTGGALDGYAEEEVRGLLTDRLERGREDLDEALDQVRALCEPVPAPRARRDYFRFFAAADSGDAAALKENEPRRLAFYKYVAKLVRAYAALAGEMAAAGYTPAEAAKIKEDVAHHEALRSELKIYAGDAVDLKRYEPAMRHLLDAYVRADESRTTSEFERKSLVTLIVEDGVDTLPEALPAGIADDEEAVAETVENNVRKLIVEKNPLNPKYYERMSALLDDLIESRRRRAYDYKLYLRKIKELAERVDRGTGGDDYPPSLTTAARRALYDNLGRDEAKAVRLDDAIHAARQDDWKGDVMKERRVRRAIAAALPGATDAELDEAFSLALRQPDY